MQLNTSCISLEVHNKEIDLIYNVESIFTIILLNIGPKYVLLRSNVLVNFFC